MIFAEMLLEFSPPLCLQPAAERKLITASTCGNKQMVSTECYCALDVLMYWRDRRTDIRAGFQLYIYIYIYSENDCSIMLY